MSARSSRTPASSVGEATGLVGISVGTLVRGPPVRATLRATVGASREFLLAQEGTDDCAFEGQKRMEIRMVFDGFRVLPEGGGMKPQLLNLWFVAKHLFHAWIKHSNK